MKISAQKSRQITIRPTAALAGRWSWNASCPTGNFSGEFEIRSTTSSGAFSGQFFSDVPGAISDGRLDGKAVTFTRHYANVFGAHLQSWTGSLTQSSVNNAQITESLLDQASGIGCTWAAMKK